MAARAQLEEMRRRALPGAPGGPVIVGPGGQILPSQHFGQSGAEEGGHGTGQYL